MDNIANYVVAVKLLMGRYPDLFWTPCVAHCIELMLEDIGKITFVKDIFESSKSITKFIYNHAYVLSLMRRFTNNKELVHLAFTWFTTSFISIQIKQMQDAPTFTKVGLHFHGLPPISSLKGC